MCGCGCVGWGGGCACVCVGRGGWVCQWVCVFILILLSEHVYYFDASSFSLSLSLAHTLQRLETCPKHTPSYAEPWCKVSHCLQEPYHQVQKLSLSEHAVLVCNVPSFYWTPPTLDLTIRNILWT